jgi:hypothetical protein
MTQAIAHSESVNEERFPSPDTHEQETKADKLVRELCRQWRSSCRLVDEYHQRGEWERAHYRCEGFYNWLEGLGSAALVTGEEAIYEMTVELRDIWFYRASSRMCFKVK